MAHRTLTTHRSILSLLRPSPERFAAAAAFYDPTPMLALRAHAERPQRQPRRTRPSLPGETGNALLLMAAVAAALVWSNSP
jgi:hypothetical protein